MKTALLILFIFTSIVVGKAQDTLYLKDGKVFYVKVYKVYKTRIEYKLYSNRDGVMLKIGRRKVKRVGFEKDINENTDQEVFAINKPLENRTRLGFDSYSFATPYPYLPSRIYYERLSEFGNYGISFPISIYTGKNGFVGYAVGVSVKKYWDRGQGFFYGALIDVGAIGYSQSDFIATTTPSFMIYGAFKLGWHTPLTDRLGINIGLDAGLMTDFDNLNNVVTIFIGFNYIITKTSKSE